jgi:uncharacterized protein YbjT (DUF2867 family)
MTPQTVLVTGATGKVGRHLVAGLLDRGVGVRALARQPLTAALPGEVRVVQGDLRRPETVETAADGADAAFLLWPGFSAHGAAEAVDALARRVRHVVYLSAARLQGADTGPVVGVWSDLERLVEGSGVGYTFLRAGGFAANTLEWAGKIRAGDVVRIPYPAAGRSLVHERDIAEVAVRALVEGAPQPRAFALTGPEVLTQAEQVRAIGDAIGRPLRAEELPHEAARRELEDVMGERAEAALTYWSTLVDRPERVTDDVEGVTGHKARSFSEWAHDHANEFVAA